MTGWQSGQCRTPDPAALTRERLWLCGGLVGEPRLVGAAQEVDDAAGEVRERRGVVVRRAGPAIKTDTATQLIVSIPNILENSGTG